MQFDSKTFSKCFFSRNLQEGGASIKTVGTLNFSAQQRQVANNYTSNRAGFTRIDSCKK